MSLLDQNLDALENRWKAEFDYLRECIAHAGEKGSALEDGFRELLRKHLPERFGVRSGFLIDANGKSSRQCDVIIFDKNTTPFIFQENICIIPIECALITIEIKSRADKERIEQICQNAASINSLERSAYIEQPMYIKNDFTDPKGRFKVLKLAFALDGQGDRSFAQNYVESCKGHLNSQGDICIFISDGRFIGFTTDGTKNIKLLRSSRPFANFISTISYALAHHNPTPINFYNYSRIKLEVVSF